MLPLESERWGELVDAYGPASKIPSLLRELEAYPPSEAPEAEPYFSLWGALCHQGDVYPASYAALPHLVRILEISPERAPWNVFALVSAIEIARLGRRGPGMPSELEASYFDALAKVPSLAMRAASAPWDHLRSRVILGCVAAAKGHPRLASAIEELEPDIVEQLLDERVSWSGP